MMKDFISRLEEYLNKTIRYKYIYSFIIIAMIVMTCILVNQALLPEKIYSIEDAHLFGIEKINGGGLISRTSDPQILLNALNNSRISNVLIKLGEPVEEDLNFQVFYAAKGEGLSETKSKRLPIKIGTSEIKVNISANIDTLRIDFADKKDRYININKVIINPSIALKDFIKLSVIYSFVIWSFFIFLWGMLLGDKSFFEFLFIQRWVIGIVVLVLCVLLELHGSSIGLYADLFGHPELNDVLLGKNRPIRSDEWLVFTPFAFSQYYSDFSLMSNIVRGTLTNMFMTYGQAVWDPAMIYRPSQWGYLFLTPGEGLAFFWMGRWIVLFLVSFEFSWRVLAKDKLISLCYAGMMAFSPVVQWWFSVNSIVEILVAGQGMVLLWKLYLTQEKRIFRIIYGATLLWCVGIYILSLYPAWQVSFGYVFLLLFVWVTLQERDKLCCVRQDAFLWCVGVFLMLAPILNVINESWDMICITKNTEYPGARFETGGHWEKNLPGLSWSFLYGASLFLPFKDIPVINNCEVANYFSLSPLGLFIFIYLCHKKKIDVLMRLLIIGCVLFTLWAFWGIPAWLAKISMLFSVPLNRGKTAADFLNLLLLCRGAYLFKIHEMYPSRLLRIILATMTAGCTTICVWQIVPDYMNISRIIISMLVISISSMIFLSPICRKGAIWILAVMFTMGATVNPLAKGVESIYGQPIGSKIYDIASKDKSLWIVEDSAGFSYSDFPIMFGAPTINSVNVYPAISRWEKLDNGDNRKIYNRYAHIPIQIVEQNSKLSFELVQGDLYRVKLRPSDLNILNVKYIMTKDNIEKKSTENVKFDLIYENCGVRIYETNYVKYDAGAALRTM